MGQEFCISDHAHSAECEVPAAAAGPADIMLEGLITGGPGAVRPGSRVTVVVRRQGVEFVPDEG